MTRWSAFEYLARAALLALLSLACLPLALVTLGFPLLIPVLMFWAFGAIHVVREMAKMGRCGPPPATGWAVLVVVANGLGALTAMWLAGVVLGHIDWLYGSQGPYTAAWYRWTWLAAGTSLLLSAALVWVPGPGGHVGRTRAADEVSS